MTNYASQYESIQKTHPKILIKYNPAYTKITGSLQSSLLLSYLISMGKGKHTITNSHIMETLALSDHGVRSAKKKIENFDFVNIEVEGLPATTTYEIDFDKFTNFMEKYVS